MKNGNQENVMFKLRNIAISYPNIIEINKTN